MEEVVIFQSTIKNGPMTNQARFYREGMTKEEILQDVYRRRMELGHEYGFDGRKIMVPLQKNANNNDLYPDGKYIVLNDTDIVYQDIDLWDIDLPCDIMVIKKGLTGVMMAYPTADCPVIIMKDKKSGTLAMAHCSAEGIDRFLPTLIADSLLQVSKTRDEDITVYVGPSASSKSYFYNTYPKWAINDRIWKYCIKEKDGKFYIDMRKAIIMEMALRNIPYENIEFSKVDTITNPNYYSNNAAFNGDTRKNGRMLVGTGYLKEEDLVKTYGIKFR